MPNEKNEIVSWGATIFETLNDIKELYCTILLSYMSDNFNKACREEWTEKKDIFKLIVKTIKVKSLHNPDVSLVLSWLDDNLIDPESNEIKIIVTPSKKIAYESNPLSLLWSRTYVFEKSRFKEANLKSHNNKLNYEHKDKDEINNFLQHVKTILIYLHDEIVQNQKEKKWSKLVDDYKSIK